MDATIDLNLLALFIAVADAASFSGAARKLGMPTSSVSRGVARLEASLGTQLLYRTTRKVALSPAGAALRERLTPLLASLRGAIGTLPALAEPACELRMTAPPDLGGPLAEVCTRFTTRYPAVKIDVSLTSRVVNLVGEGYDLALRGSLKRLKDSSMVARKVFNGELQFFGAPAYLARAGTPRGPGDAQLASHTWVALRGWRLPRQLAASPDRIRIRCDDFLFARDAVRAGAGLGCLPSFLVRDDVLAGRLVRVLPTVSQPGGAVYAMTPAARHVPPAVSAFRDLLTEHFAARTL